MKRLLNFVRAAIAVALTLCWADAYAAQATGSLPTSGPMSMSTFVSTWLNPSLAATLSNNSGSSAPSVTGQPTPYQWWMDTSANPRTLKLYEGTSWEALGKLDTTTHTWQAYTDGPGGSAKVRQPLPANLNLYVNGNSGSSASCVNHTQTCLAGSDSNDCLTISTPCLTLQHVNDQIFASYDAAGKAVTVWLAENAGTTNYALNCLNGALLGNITYNISGYDADPSQTTVTAPNGGIGMFAKDGCSLSIDGLQFKDQGSSAGAISAGNGAIPGGIDARSVYFAGTWNTGSVLVSASAAGAIINMLGPNGGGAANSITSSTSIGQAFSVNNGGEIAFANLPIAIPNAFSTTIFAVNNGGVFQGVQVLASMFPGAGTASVTGTKCQYNNAFQSSGNPNLTWPGSTLCAPRLGVMTSTTFANLPVCGGNGGALAFVSDSTTVVWGATITGGGGNPVLAFCNTANWTVAGK